MQPVQSSLQGVDSYEVNVCRMSKHAEVRLRQRGIPFLVLEWLLNYGQSRNDHKHGIVLYFDSSSRRRLRQVAAPAFALNSKYLDSYAVTTTEGKVITVGRRTRRLKFD